MKIHYHSECDFFAGCERMLVHFWMSKTLREKATVSFSFPYNTLYERGLRKAFTPDMPIYRLLTLSGDFPRNHFPGRLKVISMGFRLLTRLILTYPLLLWEIVLCTILLWRLSPNVLHLNNGGYPAARSVRAMAIAGRLVGVPNILMVVNNIAQPYNTIGRILGWPIDQLVKASVNHFICGSRYAGNELSKVLNLPEKHVLAIHNGYAPKVITENSDEVRRRLGIEDGFGGLVIGVVALMVPRKGHMVLLDALVQLGKDFPDLPSRLKVFLEGNGPTKDQLVAHVAQNGLDDIVTFVPPEDRIANFINALDILVLPSTANEDFPNVVIEAMSYGKPVVASSIAGTPEQISNGATGLLFSPTDIVALSTALRDLISEPKVAESMGLASLARFEAEFRAEIAVKKYMELYTIKMEAL